jgi:hypothetical protein
MSWREDKVRAKELTLNIDRRDEVSNGLSLQPARAHERCVQMLYEESKSWSKPNNGNVVIMGV